MSKTYLQFNSYQNEKILDKSKPIVFADDKLNVAQKTEFVFRGIEIIVGKGENGGYRHFLLFPQCFQKASLRG